MNFSPTTFTTVFKICLYTSCFGSSVCPHSIFWWHFANSSKLLKNNLIAANLNEVKSSSLTKWFFKSLEESTKCHQKILCGHTDGSKQLAYRHILKTVVKVVEEQFIFFVFFQFTCDPPRWSPLIFAARVCSTTEGSCFQFVRDITRVESGGYENKFLVSHSRGVGRDLLPPSIKCGRRWKSNHLVQKQS